MTWYEHRCRQVRQDNGGYVLECTCGWESIASPLASVVGVAWDVHLFAVGRFFTGGDG